MNKIAIYTRKSVYKENSESIETQINMCKAYFTRQFDDCSFEIFEDEGFSGKNTDRPAFKRLMYLCKLKKFDAVAVYKIDRLARNIVDFMNIYDELEKLDTKLISITEGFDPSTAMGKMMMVMLAAFADMERMNIAQRVKDNMIALAKKGCYTGGPANRGYSVEIKEDGKKYLKLENPEFIKFIYSKFNEGYSLLQVLKMQKEEFGNYALGTSPSIQRFLRSPVYVKSSKEVSSYLCNKGFEVVGKEKHSCGYITYGVTSNDPIAIVSKHTAVISPEAWLKANHRLDNIKEIFSKRESKCYWLTGVLKCSVCGSKYILANAHGRSYYTCSTRLKRGKNNPHSCTNNKYLNADKLENSIDNFVKSLFDKDVFNSYYNHEKIYINDNSKEINKQINKNEKSIKNLVEKLALLSNDAGKFLTDKIEELTLQNTNLKIKLEEIKLNKLENKINQSNPNVIYGNILNFLNAKDLEEKRRIIRLIFKSIYYDSSNHSLRVEFI